MAAPPGYLPNASKVPPQWLGYLSQALTGLGGGLLSGQNFGQGLGLGVQQANQNIAFGQQQNQQSQMFELQKRKLEHDLSQTEVEDLVQALDPATGQMVWRKKSEAAGLGSSEPKKPFIPNIETLNRGGMEETGYFNEQGEWTKLGEGPRFAPQQPQQPTELGAWLTAFQRDNGRMPTAKEIANRSSGDEWVEGKGAGGITFKYKPTTKETNLSKPGGGFYTLDELGGTPPQQTTAVSSPMPAQTQTPGQPFDFQQFQTPKQAAESDPVKIANDLRDEFVKLSAPYREVSASQQKIQAAVDNPSAAGDISLIFGYMKMLDPGSTVREGEFATAQQAQGIPSQIVGLYNKAVSGETLPQPVRDDFAAQAKSLFQVYDRQYSSLKSQYQGLATRFNVSPQDVIVEGGIPPAAATAANIDAILAKPPATWTPEERKLIEEYAK